MKRDLELVRAIVAYIEEHAVTPDGGVHEINVPGHANDEIQYHLKLLSEAGLIEATKSERISSASRWQARSLTWSGHEFLDAARDQGRWTKLKKLVAQQGTSIPFAVTQAVLIELAKREFM